MDDAPADQRKAERREVRCRQLLEDAGGGDVLDQDVVAQIPGKGIGQAVEIILADALDAAADIPARPERLLLREDGAAAGIERDTARRRCGSRGRWVRWVAAARSAACAASRPALLVGASPL